MHGTAVDTSPAPGLSWRPLLPVWATVFTGMLWLASVAPFALATAFLVWQKDAPAVGMSRLRTASHFLR